MAVRDKKCKHSKTEDKGLSSLCFIQYFGLISVTFWRKTALLCSPTTAGWDETAHAAGITSSWRFYLFYFFFSNNHITDSEREISPPNVCTEIQGW